MNLNDFGDPKYRLVRMAALSAYRTLQDSLLSQALKLGLLVLKERSTATEDSLRDSTSPDFLSLSQLLGLFDGHELAAQLKGSIQATSEFSDLATVLKERYRQRDILVEIISPSAVVRLIEQHIEESREEMFRVLEDIGENPRYIAQVNRDVA